MYMCMAVHRILSRILEIKRAVIIRKKSICWNIRAGLVEKKLEKYCDVIIYDIKRQNVTIQKKPL